MKKHNSITLEVPSAAQDVLKGTDLNSFARKLMPVSGYYCIATKVPGIAKDLRSHHWFKTMAAAKKYIKHHVKKGLQVYLAQATFKKMGTENSGRKQIYAAFLRLPPPVMCSPVSWS